MKARRDARVGGARLLPSINVRVHTNAWTGRAVSRLVPPDAAPPSHLAPTSSDWSSLATTSRSKTGPVVTRDKTVVTIRRLAPLARACPDQSRKTGRDQSEQDGMRRSVSAPVSGCGPSRSDECVYASVSKHFNADTQSGICCRLHGVTVVQYGN